MPFSVPIREDFLELIRLLQECDEPYMLTAAILAEDFNVLAELRREMADFLDGLVVLARVKNYCCPKRLLRTLGK